MSELCNHLTPVDDAHKRVYAGDQSDIYDHIQFVRHFFAYQFARDVYTNKHVLEVGCGSGYGADWVAKYAERVIGMDLSRKVIAFCQDKYKAKNLNFMNSEATCLPFVSQSIDLVISFQVIEHIVDVEKYLKEIKRVLKANGMLLISTPNRRLRLLPFQKPWNKEHVKEYNYLQFNRTLKKYFTDVEVYGLFGNEDIKKIEQCRVKPASRDAFVKSVEKYIPKTFLDTLIKFKQVLFPPIKVPQKQKNQEDPIFLRKYSFDDFYINKKCINSCLDFIASCKK